MGNTPTRKTTTSGIAGALTIIIIWGIGLAHITVPPEIASAITVVVTFATSYFVPEGEA